MSQSHIPTGCYSVRSAAERLGICTDSVLKKMIWRGWLNKGSFKTDPLKYMPLQHAIDLHLVKKVKRNAPAPYDWEIAITEAGLNELGTKMSTVNFIMVSGQPESPLNEDAQDRRHHAFSEEPTTSEKEREKFIELMKEWGIAS